MNCNHDELKLSDVDLMCHIPKNSSFDDLQEQAVIENFLLGEQASEVSYSWMVLASSGVLGVIIFVLALISLYKKRKEHKEYLSRLTYESPEAN